MSTQCTDRELWGLASRPTSRVHPRDVGRAPRVCYVLGTCSRKQLGTLSTPDRADG